MSESFIHYIWQYQYFNKTDLTTTSGESIHIFSAGFKNADAGPDFQHARIKVGEMQWVGSVEIHIDASAWYQHTHDTDEGYDNVILHVVWNDNAPVHRRDGSLLPTLELRTRVDENLIAKFRSLVNSIEVIPCAVALPSVKPLIVLNTLDKMLLHRLELKAKEVMNFVSRNRGDWEETSYQLLARNFGFKVNAEPFLQLARALPLKILMKHRDKLSQLEALLFGVAGFLDEDHEHEYYRLLQREYHLLRQKYRLDHKAMNKVQWKFLRLRPANFPTLRLAQFASFLFNQNKIFSLFVDSDEDAMVASLRNHPSEYWQYHYNFLKRSVKKGAVAGEDSIHNVLINTIVPVLAAYSFYRDDHKFMEKAIRILHHVPPESNKVLTRWKNLSMNCKDAFDSQALLEMYNNFCSRHRCLECNIGASLIKPVKS